ncbi:MAG: hypothetical protein HOQ10_07550 [Frateuria sp.]|nr:hypothetical protein [Frateuria sp.]
MKSTAMVCVLTLTAALAFAQGDPQDHADHHPEGAAAAAPTAPAPNTAAASGDRFAEQMTKMQDMHRRMQAARTPAERQALMGEHMKLMQSGMDMMAAMGGAGQPGVPQAGAAGKGPDAINQMGGMGGMMAMHGGMERRMAMMEQMMQMMVDRAAAEHQQ